MADLLPFRRTMKPESATSKPSADHAAITRLLEAAVLVAVGLVLLYFHASGRIVFYLRENFRDYALAGAVCLIVSGFFHARFFRYGLRGAENAGRDGTLPAWLPWMVVLLPMAAGMAVTRDAYSSEAIQRKAMNAPVADSRAPEVAIYSRWILSQPLEERYEQSEDGAYLIPMEELFFSGADAGVRELFSGLEIDITAQVMKERKRNPDGRRLRIYDKVITCCAADARALGFAVVFDKPAPAVEEGAWFRARGTLQYEQDANVFHPVLHIESFDPTRRPASSLLD